MNNYIAENLLIKIKDVINEKELRNFSLSYLAELINVPYNKSTQYTLSAYLRQLGFKRYNRLINNKQVRLWDIDYKLDIATKNKVEVLVDYIYFILDTDNNIVKVGISNNPTYRLSQIKTGNPFKLKIIGKIKGTQKEEQYLHKYFSEFHKDGEWFYYNQEFKNKLLHYLLNREEIIN